MLIVSGFGVKWNKVGEYMHLESCLEKEKPYTPPVNRRNLHPLAMSGDMAPEGAA